MLVADARNPCIHAEEDFLKRDRVQDEARSWRLPGPVQAGSR